MATQTRTSRAVIERATLRGVDWKTYLGLRDNPWNDHLRMSYLDGTLILMSPRYIQGRNIRRIGQVIAMVTTALEIPSQGTGPTTLTRKGPGPRKGSGKEPDLGFYLGDNEFSMRSKEQIDLEVDPPPDLAIEIDNKADSSKAMIIYARIGVPEVWRYRVKSKTLGFSRLVGETYQAIDRSLNLPRLTPSLVLHALDQADGLGETAWRGWLLEWARNLPEVPPIA